MPDDGEPKELLMTLLLERIRTLANNEPGTEVKLLPIEKMTYLVKGSNPFVYYQINNYRILPDHA